MELESVIDKLSKNLHSGKDNEGGLHRHCTIHKRPTETLNGQLLHEWPMHSENSWGAQKEADFTISSEASPRSKRRVIKLLSLLFPLRTEVCDPAASKILANVRIQMMEIISYLR